MLLRKQSFAFFFSSFSAVFTITFLVNTEFYHKDLTERVSKMLSIEQGPSDFSDFLRKMSHEHESLGGDAVAEKMYSKIKILCLIFTYPTNHYKAAVHVNATWGQKCNTLKFMTTKKETDLPTIALPIEEDRNNLWNKTKEAYKWAYAEHLQEYDWFFKGDDDTYAILENMRYILSFYDPNEPWIFGSRFKMFSKHGYMSGGGGYILSRGGVKLLVEKGLDDPEICSQSPHGAEDAEMGKCLSHLEASYGDTRDQFKRWRFFPFDFESFVAPGAIPKYMWFWDYIYYNISLSMDCCSDTAATSHYISPPKMYFYHYLMYHLRPKGLTIIPSYLPRGLFQ